MTDLPDHLIERLYAGAFPLVIWRKHRGLTQNELASLAGMPPGEVRRIENIKQFRGDQAERLAAALDIPPSCLSQVRGRWRGCEEALEGELPDDEAED